jgi:hypothetical protein
MDLVFGGVSERGYVASFTCSGSVVQETQAEVGEFHVLHTKSWSPSSRKIRCALLPGIICVGGASMYATQTKQHVVHSSIMSFPGASICRVRVLMTAQSRVPQKLLNFETDSCIECTAATYLVLQDIFEHGRLASAEEARQQRDGNLGL